LATTIWVSSSVPICVIYILDLDTSPGPLTIPYSITATTHKKNLPDHLNPSKYYLHII